MTVSPTPYVIPGGVAKTGLGIMLRVMSGDRIDIYGKSYYFQNATSSNAQLPVIDILSGLLGAPTGVTAGKAVTAAGLNSMTDVYNGVHNFLSSPDRNNGDTINPQSLCELDIAG